MFDTEQTNAANLLHLTQPGTQSHTAWDTVSHSHGTQSHTAMGHSLTQQWDTAMGHSLGHSLTQPGTQSTLRGTLRKSCKLELSYRIGLVYIGLTFKIQDYFILSRRRFVLDVQTAA